MNEVNWDTRGNIFNIQRFSLHDGDGIRTIVFLKGCSLRCKWCSNPESQSFGKELMFKEINCIKCGKCIEVCKNGAISFEEGSIKINRELCKSCGVCSIACCSNALEIMGKEMTVQELFKEVVKDKVFYEESGGGITLSGGEALLQPEFSSELLKACKLNGINTTIETAGNVPKDNLIKVMKYVDTFLYDIKVMDGNKHKEYTLVSNEKIIENLCLLAKNNKVIIRIPLIKGVNDSEDNIEELLNMVNTIGGIKEIHLLPYHKLGVSKYMALGRTYELDDLGYVEKDSVEKLKFIIEKRGYFCIVGG